MYAAQQTGKASNAGAPVTPAHSYKKPMTGGGGGPSGGGGGNHNNGGKMRYSTNHNKPSQAKPQPLHYCEVCKISCAGPQTYREHLEGQKHKKRQAGLKLVSIGGAGNTGSRHTMHCELCDVTCTGVDAYAAHVRGSKHQKVVKLHQKLGKPIPQQDAAVPVPKKVAKINFVSEAKPSMVVDGGVTAAATPATAAAAATVTGPATAMEVGGGGAQDATTGPASATATASYPPQSDIKPVGLEYIEEIREENGSKILSFNCKLCDCKFNDPNAKEMHMKGRRHRLQYKKKVQPDLVVDLKQSPRRLKLAEAKTQREMWNARFTEEGGPINEEEARFWEHKRRFEEEASYGIRMQRTFAPGMPVRGPPNFGNGPQGSERRVDSSDDRHMVAKHAEIYPKVEELQVIQRIVSHTERALKFVSDALTAGVEKKAPVAEAAMVVDEKAAEGGEKPQEAAKVPVKSSVKEDGRDNQMFSFQKDADGIVRVLKGVMRVGLLAKGKWRIS